MPQLSRLRKFIYLISYLQLVLWISCASGQANYEKNTLRPSNIIKNDSIVLINTSGNELGFIYEDKFLVLENFHLKAFDTIRIFAEEREIITQTNQNQNFYLVYPGDTIFASTSKRGNTIFEVKNDSVRNNELNLQWKINEGTPLNFMKILQLRSRYFNSDCEKMDSVYWFDYNSKINFINKYKTHHPISVRYEIAVKKYYKSFLFASELWLGTASKAKLSASYIAYLNSLKDSINKLNSTAKEPLYPFLSFGYERFKLRDSANSKDYFDSLYIYCKKFNNTEEGVLQIVLYDIVKRALKNNPTEKWFVKDFIENIADKDYKLYTNNLIKDNSLMAEGLNNNEILNQKNRIFQYDSLVNSLKGTAIYIDVWASWCKPCIAEIPFSASLRKRYKGKHIRFMYLSIDDNITTWKKENMELNLNGYPYSYLLLKAQQSDFINKFKLRSIPRYILINKKGNIENVNALRPSDKGIMKSLDSLVNEK